MTKLAREITDLESDYEAVVVGSGYGGAIAASRLARMGLKVALLERGLEWPLGQFPDEPKEASRETQVTSRAGRIGGRTALFDLHVGDDISVLVGCGLGGTSLINANVALQPDPRVFQDEIWPQEIRREAGEPGSNLGAGFAAARKMLQPAPYPQDWPRLAKLTALEEAARELDTQCTRPPINVRFQSGPNAAGVWQSACNLCGDCCSGCNVGAKNTTAMNYLPDAVAHGCSIFCGTRVRHVENAADGRWRVAFLLDRGGRGRFEQDELHVFADHVFLAAGTLGSTEILLRSREEGLDLSPRLGRCFSGNGDVLAFGYNNDVPIHGIGKGKDATRYDPDAGRSPPVGPTITGLVDLRATAALDDGMIIEEGSIPGGIAQFMPAIMAAAAAALGSDSDTGDRLSELARELKSIVLGPDRGAVDHTQTYLVMSHDGSDGQLTLDGERLTIHWPGVGERPSFESVAANLARATRANGGIYVPNPIWTDQMDHNLVTVHPLGGCTMGASGQEGVVDHACRVYDGSGGIHRGLHVCDGAVVPRSIGVNPLLTISALAERALALFAEREGLALDIDSPTPVTGPGKSPHVGLRFTERMAGTLTSSINGSTSEGNFIATITAINAAAFFADRNHTAEIMATARIPALSDQPLTGENGRFQLFIPDPRDPAVRYMEYRIPLSDSGGNRYSLYGQKTIRDDPGFDAWADTTTLAVEVRQGAEPDGPILFTGTYRIAIADFARQLATLEVLNAPDMRTRVEYLGLFGKLFAASLVDSYLS